MQESMSNATPQLGAQPNQESNIVETLQSLIVAFSLAMTVRSFVTEGFVIPTGSMAPTLMGQHARFESPATGYSFPFDVQPAFEPQFRGAQWPLVDPMVSQLDPILTRSSPELAGASRTGDRVLVLKYLYAFREPERWDVVVFKNPTDPSGDAANYIKRLVGLPDEQLVMVDGDIFTAPIGAARSEFRIARKPEHVQRAVWQPVHDSDYEPIDRTALAKAWGRMWMGAPWDSKEFRLGLDDTPGTRGRGWVHEGSGPARLDWRWDRMQITDWGSYNALRAQAPSRRFSVSDLRVAVAIEAQDPAALSTEYTLTTRRRTMRFAISGGEASITIATQGESEGEAGVEIARAAVPMTAPAAGAPFEVEFWHVDERLAIWVNGDEVVSVDDRFESLEDRVVKSYYGRTVEDYATRPAFQQPTPPALSLAFDGSPLVLTRVRVDRDLYYRTEVMSDDPRAQAPQNGPPIRGLAFGSDLLSPAQIQSDEFMMCGDNSAFSRDSRLLGRPSQLVTSIYGTDAPFVVPRPLLLGKAWCVYFPAPVPPMDGLPAVLPDFGSFRFIR